MKAPKSTDAKLIQSQDKKAHFFKKFKNIRLFYN